MTETVKLKVSKEAVSAMARHSYSRGRIFVFDWPEGELWIEVDQEVKEMLDQAILPNESISECIIRLMEGG